MEFVHQWLFYFGVFSFFFTRVYSSTDPNDLKILNDFKKGLDNPELLKWPENGGDPCGPPSWPHVFCSDDRVTQIQVQNLGLKGPLPQTFNQLTMLYNLGLQKNHFTGKLPTFSGLSELEFTYLDNNEFDTIPADFFDGFSSVRVLALDYNPFNKTTGWSIPIELANSVQLTNLSLVNCNVVGPLPDFLGKLPSLVALKLSYNRLSGEIPASFGESLMQILWLNDQDGDGMTGNIDVVANMVSLTQLWLHGNQFTGTIPENIGNLTSLKDLNLNRNQLVGLIPESLANMELDNLVLNNNQLGFHVPRKLLHFWISLVIYVINFPRHNLSGTLSPSVAKLESLIDIRLGGNSIHGTVPENFTKLKALRTLDLSGNNLEPPLPKFGDGVKLVIDGNPLLANHTSESPSPASSTSPASSDSPPSDQSDGTKPPPSRRSLPPSRAKNSNSSIAPTSQRESQSKSFERFKVLIVAGGAAVAILVLLVILFSIFWCKKSKRASDSPSSIVVHPKDPSAPENMVKIAFSNNTTGSLFSKTAKSPGSSNSSATQSSHLGRGGFGTVYTGELDDGTKLAVKRMEAGVISSKALDEFQSEIAVLSKVRHRHLVSLLGYSIEGNERLLVYEYMSQGALSKHLFHWRTLKLEPLSWRRRLSIALDVARGMEYLHNLARETFIHRDLKSSNILLDDDFRAKVSDFGLVKLAPDGEKSVATRLAGTFGYLAPEYAVMGKITTKVDVFSYGVVLMELLTGLTALDEDRSEESRYLVEWFDRIKSNEEKLMAAIDSALEVSDETRESIYTVAELAGHCTGREPYNRPDMGHVVTVLATLVEKWKPVDDESECCSGIDYNQPLSQMLKVWQAAESQGLSYTSLDDSKGSIPAKPSGFADSFTSADGR
ncbi:histone deacetylase 8-like isoform X1 [Hibiscus syriacus]|uniref:non-specific serine/threonine protein kinase n=1 Tax=Hibiscus syriacus TaxID=106335 RepID=A0A6A3D1V9_HIBSY|nr:histone deacetylase 8-like isoform X1 [Hibiscus syriacus]